MQENTAGRAPLPAAAAISLLVALTYAAGSMVGAAAEAPEGREDRPLDLEPISSPAGADSLAPNLVAAGDGGAYLSWLEPAAKDRHALRFAKLDGDAWGPARTITAGDGLFVNWADVPSMQVHPDGTLAAHWLAYNGDGTYAYGVRIAFSRDDGATWSEPVRPHSDTSPVEHGFVSMVPRPPGGFLAVWLDGRKFSPADGDGGHGPPSAGAEMTLRTATSDGDGTFSPDRALDRRVCDCCPTSAAAVADGVLVAYRDRSEEEIRDIYTVRRGADGWGNPRRLAADGWRIPGCPVNGPAVAADGERAAIAWFTMVDGAPRAQVAFSADGGRSFGDAIRFDDGTPLGRVDVVLLEDGRALVGWLEHRDGEAELLVRPVAKDGTTGPATALVTTSSSRSSGYPRLLRVGKRLIVAWRQVGADAGVRAGVVRLDG